MSVKQSARKRSPTATREDQLLNTYQVIAGVDEVGRGAWAGPLVAAALVLRNHRASPTNRVKRIYGVRDSKLLTLKQRQKLATAIKRLCRAWSVGIVEAKDLNRVGLARAIKLAQVRAIRKLQVRPNYVLVDGNGRHRIDRIKTEHIVKADQKVLSVAAASIIAKVYRDRLMRSIAKKYPMYCFDQNKGYGTKLHQRALKKVRCHIRTPYWIQTGQGSYLMTACLKDDRALAS